MSNFIGYLEAVPNDLEEIHYPQSQLQDKSTILYSSVIPLPISYFFCQGGQKK